MSNDPRENLHGSDSQELADVTAAAEQASQTPAQSMADALAEMSTPSFEETLSALDEADASSAQEAAATLTEDGALDPQETLVSDAPLVATSAAEATPASFSTNTAASNTTGNDLVVAAPVHLPPAEPRPWYRSRRSFSAKGRGGRVQVAGLGITYTDHASGAVLLANIDLGFRARSLSAILDPTGRRARALFLILAGLEEPQAGRIVAAPSRKRAARSSSRPRTPRSPPPPTARSC